MNRELAAYLRLQVALAAAFNFFIGGMTASLIYHKADFVPTEPISIAIDLTFTYLLTFAIAMLLNLYMALKRVFFAALGALATCTKLYAGMYRFG